MCDSPVDYGRMRALKVDEMREVTLTDVRCVCAVQPGRNASSCLGEPWSRMGTLARNPKDTALDM